MQPLTQPPTNCGGRTNDLDSDPLGRHRAGERLVGPLEVLAWEPRRRAAGCSWCGSGADAQRVELVRQGPAEARQNAGLPQRGFAGAANCSRKGDFAIAKERLGPLHGTHAHHSLVQWRGIATRFHEKARHSHTTLTPATILIRLRT